MLLPDYYLHQEVARQQLLLYPNRPYYLILFFPYSKLVSSVSYDFFTLIISTF